MPELRHPTLPPDQTITPSVYGPDLKAAGWVPVADESAPEPPAEPVNPAPASASRDLTKEK